MLERCEQEKVEKGDIAPCTALIGRVAKLLIEAGPGLRILGSNYR